jgi:hypothetical protein
MNHAIHLAVALYVPCRDPRAGPPPKIRATRLKAAATRPHKSTATIGKRFEKPMGPLVTDTPNETDGTLWCCTGLRIFEPSMPVCIVT